MLPLRDTELRSSADSLTLMSHSGRRTPRRRLAWPWPGSPVRSPLRARLAAIDAELAGRTAVSGPGYPAPRAPSLRRAALVLRKTPGHLVPGRHPARPSLAGDDIRAGRLPVIRPGQTR